MLIAKEVALDVVRSPRTTLVHLARQDRNLADQARRAATSLVLNVDEGARREGKDRLHFFRIAAGSGAELRAALEVGLAWAYLDEGAVAPTLQLLDRTLGLLWGLTHVRHPPEERKLSVQ